MVRKVVAGTGRTLITVGVLLLLFVAYQLWGTGIQYEKAQNKAANEFEALLESSGQTVTEDPFAGFDAADLGVNPDLSFPVDGTAAETTPVATTPLVTTTTPTTTTPTTAPPASTTPVDAPVQGAAAVTTIPKTTVATAPAATVTTLPKVRPGRSKMQRPKPGKVLGRIVIPKIKRSEALVEGAGVEDLKTGPGHYPSTPLPGELGNVGIAGHRTTYGNPFFNLDLLEPGDPIYIQTLYGKFRYDVERSFIVSPKDRKVLANTPDESVLTLTTCHPKYSAAQRLIVRARLVGEAVDTDFFFEPETVPTTTKAPEPVATTEPVATSEAIAFDTAAPVVVETTIALPDTSLADDPTVSEPTVPEDAAAATFDEPVSADTVAVPGTEVDHVAAERSGTGPVWHFGWFTGRRSIWMSTFQWAGVCGAIWFAAWLFARSRRRAARALIYTVGFVVLFLPALYLCYENLARLLPENV